MALTYYPHKFISIEMWIDGFWFPNKFLISWAENHGLSFFRNSINLMDNREIKPPKYIINTDAESEELHNNYTVCFVHAHVAMVYGLAMPGVTIWKISSRF